MDSPAAQVALASAALDEAFAAEAIPAAASSAATMEMISEVPAGMMAETDGSAVVAANAPSEFVAETAQA
jgi:hypothetical protein